jgi:hypothetical protein
LTSTLISRKISNEEGLVVDRPTTLNEFRHEKYGNDNRGCQPKVPQSAKSAADIDPRVPSNKRKGDRLRTFPKFYVQEMHKKRKGSREYWKMGFSEKGVGRRTGQRT